MQFLFLLTIAIISIFHFLSYQYISISCIQKSHSIIALSYSYACLCWTSIIVNRVCTIYCCLCCVWYFCIHIFLTMSLVTCLSLVWYLILGVDKKILKKRIRGDNLKISIFLDTMFDAVCFLFRSCS